MYEELSFKNRCFDNPHEKLLVALCAVLNPQNPPCVVAKDFFLHLFGQFQGFAV